MATSPSAIFSGTSRFSSDFQQVISRAVQIAQLPGNQLRQQQTTVTNQSSELATLQGTFNGLQTSLNNLNTAVTGSQVTASTSTGGILSTTVTTALPGTYNVNILSLGSTTTSLSKATLPTVADPAKDGISTANSLTLTVNGTSRTLTPASTSLDDLVSSINSNSDLGVRATIVNFGTSTAPSYQLSVQSTNVGNDTITLNDGRDLLDTVGSGGTPMTYQLNGVSTTLSANSRTVTVSPGLSISAIATGQTDVVVSPSGNSIANAISSFVSSYNGAVSAVDGQRGQSGGALSGQAIVADYSNGLSALTNYFTGAKDAGSLADLGLTFDKNGVLSFDQTAFTSAFNADPAAVTTFLGQSSQSGFLKSAGDILTNLVSEGSDASTAYANSISDYATRIAVEDDHVAQMQSTITDKMNAADALVASLEQQVSYITGLFAAESQLSYSQSH